MTQEEQVLIRGKCFLYRQKAPFVPSGQSVYGALEYNDQRDEVRCHECGEWFRFLATHVWRTHGLPTSDYRKKHGLRKKCALCGPRFAAAITVGKEEYYQRLRLRVQSPDARAAFGAMSRAAAAAGRTSGKRTDIAERRNEEGHCPAQLAERLKQLYAQYGRTPSRAELMEHGLSPESICLVFNLPTMREVLKFLEMAHKPKTYGYTREALIEILRDFWAKYGRLPGRAHERMGMIPRDRVFTRIFGSKAAAYEAAGLSLAASLLRSPYSREGLIDQMREFYQQHGEVPRASRKYGRKHGDALPPGFPSRRVFSRIFGSMPAAYEAAGLSIA